MELEKSNNLNIKKLKKNFIILTTIIILASLVSLNFINIQEKNLINETNEKINSDENFGKSLKIKIVELEGKDLFPLLNVHVIIPRLVVFNGNEWIEIEYEVAPYEFGNATVAGTNEVIESPHFEPFIKNSTKIRFILPEFKTYEEEKWWRNAKNYFLNLRFKLEIYKNNDLIFIGYFYYTNSTYFLPPPRPNLPLLDKFYLKIPEEYLLKDIEIKIGNVEKIELGLKLNQDWGYPNTRYYVSAFWKENFKASNSSFIPPKSKEVVTPYHLVSATLKVEVEGKHLEGSFGSATIKVDVNNTNVVNESVYTGEKHLIINDATHAFTLFKDYEDRVNVTVYFISATVKTEWEVNVTLIYSYEADSEKYVKTTYVDFLNYDYAFTDYSAEFYGHAIQNGMFLKRFTFDGRNALYYSLFFEFYVYKTEIPDRQLQCQAIDPPNELALVKIYINNYKYYEGYLTGEWSIFGGNFDVVIDPFLEAYASFFFNSTLKITIYVYPQTNEIYFPPENRYCAIWNVVFGSKMHFRPEPWADNSLKWLIKEFDEGGPHFTGKGMSLSWYEHRWLLAYPWLENEMIGFAELYPIISSEEVSSRRTYSLAIYANAYIVANDEKGRGYGDNKRFITFAKLEINSGISVDFPACSAYISHNGVEHPEIKKQLEEAQRIMGGGFEVSEWLFLRSPLLVKKILEILIYNFIDFLKKGLTSEVTINVTNNGCTVIYNPGAFALSPTIVRIEAVFYGSNPPQGYHEGYVRLDYAIRQDNFSQPVVKWAWAQINYNT